MARPAYGDGPGASPAFLADGGVMGALIRAHDWAATPLGPPEGWPQGLKTALRLALTTRHPMFIFWGPEHICLYNDGYRPSLGPEKHPSILGAPGRPAWAEIWEIIGPQIELVMRGEGATWHENQLVPIVRHGGLQDVYWTYTFGPIDDATAPSGIGGVLVVCTETTQQVLAERRAKTERERLAAMFQQAPGFICTLRGPDHVFEFVNDEHRRLFNSAGWVGKPVREAFPDIAGQGFYELLDQVYATGERVVMHGAPVRFRLTPEAAEQELLIDFIYAPMRDETGSITGIYCSGNDVTEQKRRELNAAILDLVGKDLALLATPDEIMQAVGARVGGFLRLSGCIFADVDEERGDVAVHHAWTAGNVPSLLRQTFRLDDYLSEEFGRAGRAGETFVVRDTAGDERDRGTRQDAKLQNRIGAAMLRGPEQEVRIGDEREGTLPESEEIHVKADIACVFCSGLHDLIHPLFHRQNARPASAGTVSRAVTQCIVPTR